MAPYESTEGYATSQKDFSFASRDRIGHRFGLSNNTTKRASKFDELEQRGEMSGYEANVFDEIESEQLLKNQSNKTSNKTEQVSYDSIQYND